MVPLFSTLSSIAKHPCLCCWRREKCHKKNPPLPPRRPPGGRLGRRRQVLPRAPSPSSAHLHSRTGPPGRSPSWWLAAGDVFSTSWCRAPSLGGGVGRAQGPTARRLLLRPAARYGAAAVDGGLARGGCAPWWWRGPGFGPPVVLRVIFLPHRGCAVVFLGQRWFRRRRCAGW